MRQFIGGDGSDTTAAVTAYLATHKQIYAANLYLIGEPEDPQSIWLTDWESPLVWGPWSGAPGGGVGFPAPPRALAAGESMAWAIASTLEGVGVWANPPSIYNCSRGCTGAATGNRFSGNLGMTGADSFGRNSVSLVWKNYALPLGIPRGATIVDVYPAVQVAAVQTAQFQQIVTPGGLIPVTAGLHYSPNIGTVHGSITATISNTACASAGASGMDLSFVGMAVISTGTPLTSATLPGSGSALGKIFLSTVIKRSSIASKIGLDADALTLTWSPQNTALTSSLGTANFYQLARLGWFDNKRVRVWRTIMPTPGDANTFGACELFAGFIGDVKPQRGSIELSVNSYLYLLNQKVPSGIIEATDTLASYTGFTKPSGFSQIPQFSIVAGSTTNVLICNQISPSGGSIPATDTLNDGAVIFNNGAGATLGGAYSIIGRNDTFIDGGGGHHTRIYLYSELPWAPTPGQDAFFISGTAPTGDGFPYVPSPETAI